MVSSSPFTLERIAVCSAAVVLTYTLLLIYDGSIRKYTLCVEQKRLNLMAVSKEHCFLPLAAVPNISEPDSSHEAYLKRDSTDLDLKLSWNIQNKILEYSESTS